MFFMNLIGSSKPTLNSFSHFLYKPPQSELNNIIEDLEQQKNLEISKKNKFNDNLDVTNLNSIQSKSKSYAFLEI